MLKKILLMLVAAQLFLFASATATPEIHYNTISWTDEREQLTREYALLHYGMDTTTIDPRAVVVHWTAGSTFESAFNTFFDAVRGDGSGTVNVSSQFIVDRDGTIYSIMPETKLARHAIGYNWCAIGIENVGGVGNVEDLTPAQLQANIELIRYLREKYSGIEYVFGHYQQDIARESGLYIEHVAGYFSIKPDPGKIFMQALKDALEDVGFKFFPI